MLVSNSGARYVSGPDARAERVAMQMWVLEQCRGVFPELTLLSRTMRRCNLNQPQQIVVTEDSPPIVNTGKRPNANDI